MKKFLMVLAVLVLGGCYTEYYIPLSDDCMDAKIAEIKKNELKKANVRGRTFELMYDGFDLKPNIGDIKFDNKMKITYRPSKPYDDPAKFEQQMEIRRKVKEIVDGINTNKYIEVVYMRAFDIDCYSGGGSVKVPYWLIEQEVRFKVEVKDPLFLAAFEHYLGSEGRYMRLVK